MKSKCFHLLKKASISMNDVFKGNKWAVIVFFTGSAGWTGVYEIRGGRGEWCDVYGEWCDVYGEWCDVYGAETADVPWLVVRSSSSKHSPGGAGLEASVWPGAAACRHQVLSTCSYKKRLFVNYGILDSTNYSQNFSVKPFHCMIW